MSRSTPDETGAPPAVPVPPPPTDMAAALSLWRGAAMLGLALGLAAILLAALWLLFHPLLLLLLAVVIATALEPLVGRLERWLPRALAVVAVYLALLLLLVGLGWLIVPAIVAQAQTLVENAPDLVERASAWFNRWGGNEEQVAERLRAGVGQFGTVLVTLPVRVVAAATELFLVLAMSLYWLIVAPSLRRFVLSLFPEPRREQASAVLAEMGRTMGGYVRGAALDGLIMGALVYVGLRVLGVEYPLVLAVLVALGELVPIVGPFAAAIPAVAIALTDSPAQALKVAAFYAVVQQVESNIVEPNIMSKQTDMPPLLVLFALLAGSAVAGILGAVVAIPLAGALRVLGLRVLAPAIRHWSGADPPRPASAEHPPS